MLDKICKTKKELLKEIKNKKDYLNNYEIMINNTGFVCDYFEQNLYYFLIDNFKYYNIKTWNNFFNWFYSGTPGAKTSRKLFSGCDLRFGFFR